MVRMIGTAALWLIALAAAPASAQAPRWAPQAGTFPYRFETVSHVPGGAGNAFRLDYDLVSDGKGGLVAVVKAAWNRTTAPEWSDTEVDAECRKAMGAEGDELARVRLAPLPADVVTNPAKGFMPDCAPPELFFPMMDILTATSIQVAPVFGLAQLAKPGDSHPFPGYTVKLDRADTLLDLETAGGTVLLATAAPGRATFVYQTNPSKVSIVNRRAYNGADITLTGTASGGIRFEINPDTGVLLGGESVDDKLDVTVSLPGGFSQPLPITREMTIKPR